MWQPEEESLKLLADLLNQSQSPDNEKQKEVFRVYFYPFFPITYLEN